MPCDVTRKLIGEDKILGVSAATIEEAKKAQMDGADYIGTGAVFPTHTKDDAPKITKNDLKEINVLNYSDNKDDYFTQVKLVDSDYVVSGYSSYQDDGYLSKFITYSDALKVLEVK